MEAHALVSGDMLSSLSRIMSSDEGTIKKLCLADVLLCNATRGQKELGKAMAIILAKEQDMWADLEQERIYELWKELRWCSEEEFNYSFESYAIHRTGLSWSTISNMMRVARVWYLDEPEVPERIQLMDGKSGEPTGEIVEGFDTALVDTSKLLLCTSLQKKGEMDEEAWGLLANPDVTHKALRARLMNSSKVDYRHRIVVEDGLMYVMGAAIDGRKAFGSLETDSDDEDVAWAVGRVLAAVGAKVK